METLCNECPRKCGVDRSKNIGFCGETNTVRVAKVMIHHWEEPIISGTNGSGAIFFSGCNLRCNFCQNHEISTGGIGKSMTTYELAQTFKTLEKSGVHNINLVTPSHFAQQIVEALKIYHPNIPIVWNTSSYEIPETLELLRGYVDIFLADLKYCSSELSSSLSSAPDYFDKATSALLKMKELCPTDQIENDIMKSGLIIRYLILPTQTKDGIKILDWVSENLPKSTILSVMSQYTPCHKAKFISWLNQKIKPLENKIIIQKCISLGFENVFYQDMDSASTDYIPNFSE